MAAGTHSLFGNEAAPLPSDPALRERDERLEALKSVVGHLAHDFNNYLVPLLGYVTLIREDTPPDSTAGQFSGKLEASARKTEAAIEQILLAARPQRKYLARPGSFSSLVLRTTDAWKAELPPGAHIEISRDAEPFDWTFDESHWTAALRHLLNNARYGLAMGGKLEVMLTLETVPSSRAGALGLACAHVAKLMVRDSGFGMSEAVLRRACEPFFTTRPKGQGAGLGLTAAHSLARLHGGQLVIESAEDAGTTVTLWLPQSAASPSAAAPVVGAASADSGSLAGRKMLVVDDDPLVLEVIKAYLQKSQVEVLLAPGGAEALRLYKKHAGTLSLIVSDITMPGMTGVEFYSHLRQMDPNIRFLFMSGDADAASSVARLESPHPGLLKKPFTLKSFTETVKSLF